jgi:hypothetical protein
MINPKSKYYKMQNKSKIPNPKLEFGNWKLFGSIGSIGNWDFK